MNKTLVTILNDNIDSALLLKVGEMRVKFNLYNGGAAPSSKSQKLNVSTNGEELVSIIGNGHFTDSQLQQNLGNSLDISNVTNLNLYVSNSECEVSFSNKYNITKISSNWAPGDELWPNTEDRSTKGINVRDLMYSKHLTILDLAGEFTTGDLADLSNLLELNELAFTSCNNITGNIKSLSGLTNLENLLLYDCQRLEGNLSDLATIVKLKNLAISSDKVNGNIKDVKSMPELISLTFTHLVGDISELKDTKIQYLNGIHKSSLSGDFAVLPADFCYARFIDDAGSKFSWSSRQSSAKIITIKGYVEFENVDTMLINQAQCTANEGDKIIEVKGNRTSASDDAIQTLQGKGYTVSIATV